MIPATLTVSAMLGYAQTVVTSFGGLILLVAGLAFGIWAAKFTLSRVRRLG